MASASAGEGIVVSAGVGVGVRRRRCFTHVPDPIIFLFVTTIQTNEGFSSTKLVLFQKKCRHLIATSDDGRSPDEFYGDQPRSLVRGNETDSR